MRPPGSPHRGGRGGKTGGRGSSRAEAGRQAWVTWVNAGMEISSPALSCPLGPHHECAAEFGERPVGTGLAEGTHPVLLFAGADLLPTGKEGAAGSLPGLGLSHRFPFTSTFAPSAAAEPQQPAPAHWGAGTPASPRHTGHEGSRAPGKGQVGKWGHLRRNITEHQDNAHKEHHRPHHRGRQEPSCVEAWRQQRWGRESHGPPATEDDTRPSPAYRQPKTTWGWRT